MNRGWTRLLGVVLLSGWTAAVIWRAWAADDAFITWRTVDNALNGYGLRWNVAERVQAYTHPLWMFLTLGATWLTGDVYRAAMWLSIASSAAAVGIVIWRMAPGAFAALLCVTLFVSSRAFLDYSTSGLENPLTHLLIVLFVLVWWKARAGVRKTFFLSLLLAGVMLNRIDAGLLVMPAFLVAAWQRPIRPHVAATAAGLIPLAAWEAFSIVYYGFPFPNTAYAKLSTGVSELALLGQAVHYFTNSLWTDAPTLLTVGAALGITMTRAGRPAWPLALGMAIYLVYILRIGGDFMAGRFFAAPFLVAVLIVCRGPLPQGRMARGSLLASAIALWAVLALIPFDISMPHGITDQRRLYADGTRFITQAEYPLAGRPEVQRGLALRDGRRHVREWGMIGMTGYFAGPDVHIIDTFALADPLLSRRPANPKWRIGHFERRVPEGYGASVRTGENRLASRVLAPVYDDILLVTRGPLWTRDRWRAIVRLNLFGGR